MFRPNTFDEAREILAGEETIALDLETSGFSPWQDSIHVISMFGQRSKKPVILHYPKGHRVPMKVMNWLGEFPEIVTHNGTMFDTLFLANGGMPWNKPKHYDTLVGECAVIKAARRDVRVNLQDTLRRRVGKTIDKNINHESWQNQELDSDQVAYLHGDISHLLSLQDEQMKRATESHDMLRNVEFEMSLIPAVVQMELNGLPINVKALHAYLAAEAVKADALQPMLEGIFDRKIIDDPKKRTKTGNELLISSPVALKKALQEKFGSMFQSTSKETLMEYKVFGGELGECCDFLLQFRYSDRREKMYSDKWQRENIVNHDGFGDTRVHGKFWQIGTDTGRFSSSSPNLQQIPRDMRHVFESPEGYLIGATDYSGIEVRVAAALADDRDMIGVFSRGEDIHTAVASAGFNKPESEITKEERRIAKAMSFTLLFGGGAETFKQYAANNGSQISLEMAELAVERFFERFEGIARMRQSALWKAANQRTVTLVYPTGLQRTLFNETLRGSVILNNIVQGTAAAGLKFALKECYDIGLGKYISAVVHDEIVYVARANEIIDVRDAIEDCMISGMLRALEDATPIPVEVESHYGRTWNEEQNKSTSHSRSQGGFVTA